MHCSSAYFLYKIPARKHHPLLHKFNSQGAPDMNTNGVVSCQDRLKGEFHLPEGDHVVMKLISAPTPIRKLISDRSATSPEWHFICTR